MNNFKHLAFIFLAPGFNPKSNSVTTEQDRVQFKAVGLDINQKEDVLIVAKRLAQEGYRRIELSGDFGSEWVNKVSIELENKIPVGGVFRIVQA